MGLKVFLRSMGADGAMFSVVSSAAAVSMVIFGYSHLSEGGVKYAVVSFFVACVIWLFGFSFTLGVIEERSAETEEEGDNDQEGEVSWSES